MPRFVTTDEPKLRQVLINLIGNAAKFTSAGGIVVRADAAPSGEGQVRLAIEVEDTGPGIHDEELPRLFQQFEQARAGVQVGSGTGLGLAISRGFARLMGGDITVRSTPGAGSVFTVSLPVSVSSGEGWESRSPKPRVRSLPAGLAAPRVLVADDVPENRVILADMLRRIGISVRLASNGREAVDQFAEWHPDLVLMDLRMPVLDGYEAIREMRGAETGRRTPVVVVSASTFEQNREHAEAAGADDFIGKPFREAELFQKVGRLLGIAWVTEDEAPSPERPESPVGEIPGPLREALREAVVRADTDRFGQLLEELARTDPGTASTLRRLGEEFENERLLELLGPEEEAP